MNRKDFSIALLFGVVFIAIAAFFIHKNDRRMKAPPQITDTVILYVSPSRDKLIRLETTRPRDLYIVENEYGEIVLIQQE